LKSGTPTTLILAAALAVAALSGCTTITIRNPIPVEEMRMPPGDYRIGAGVVLDVKLYYRPELNERTRVRPDGKISLQLIGDVVADGVSAADLSREIQRRYGEHLHQPETTVIVRSFEGQIAFIDGEVGKPGMVKFHRTPSIYQAVVLAGGLQVTAARNIKLIRNRGNERPAVAVIDVRELLQHSKDMDPIYLRPYDVVYVPKSFITRVNDFIDQYIDGVIPQAAQQMLGINWWWNAIGSSGVTVLE